MQMLNRLSIKSKLIIIILSSTLFASLIAIAVIAIIDLHDYKESKIVNGTLQAKLVAEYVKVSLEFNDSVWAEHVISKLSEIPDIIEGVVYKQEGEILASFKGGIIPSELSTFVGSSVREVRDNILYIREPVLSENGEIGSIVLIISLESLVKRRDSFILSVLLVMLLISVISFVLAHRLQNIISKPIIDLANAARKISENKEYIFSLTTTNQDEVGSLYTEFAELIKQVNNRDKELREARSYLNNIIDSMPSILIGINEEGMITSMNKMAEERATLSREEAIGKPMTSIFLEYGKYLTEIKSTIESRKPILKSKIDDSIAQKTNIVNLTAYPLIGNGVNGAVIRIDDVTDRVRMEEMMVQTEKMMSIGGLAAGMAHEINNPLGIIAQGAQNIEQKVRGDLNANLRAAEKCGISMDALRSYFEQRHIFEFITDIREATSRASSIVSNILNFSRKSDNLRSSTNIPNLIDKTIDLVATDFDLKKQYDFKSIEIKRNYAKNLPLITVCETEIEQVLINILKNGAQAMAGESDKKHIFTITVKEDIDWMVIEIADNGPGIPEKIKSRIFEPFFTTKPIGVGTGLGLSVSYMIIQKNHNGLMRVESSPGKGTTFIIKLPLQVTL